MKTQTPFEKLKSELAQIAKDIHETELIVDIEESEAAENLAELRLDREDYGLENLTDWSN